MQRSVLRALRLAPLAAVAAAAAGCAEAPLVHTYEPPEAPPPLVDLPEYVGVVPVVEGGVQPLTGQVKDYVTNAPLTGVSLSSYGLTPPLSVTSQGEGAYSVDVPVGSIFWIKASGPDVVSTYDQVTMPVTPYEKTIYALTSTAFQEMQAGFGKTQDPGCGAVVAYFVKPDGTAQANLGEIALDRLESQGPYFLNDVKAADPALQKTSASGRAVFFNVCAAGGGALTGATDAAILLNEAAYTAPPALIKVFPGAVTIVKVTVTPGTPVEPPPPQPTIDFETEIMPIFVANACAACHAEGGTAAGTGLYFNGPAEEVYNLLRTGTSRVNLQYPSQSYVLVRPLLEDPPDHPNAAFPSTADPSYLKVLQWIEEGAYWSPTNPEPPPLEEPVDFAVDVYPIFQVQGRGCAACHDAVTYSGNLDLTGGPDVVYQRIVDKGLYDLNYPERSKLLRNPYCGPDYCANDPQYPETHPTRVFVATTDPDYQAISLWIGQGAAYYPGGLPPPPPNPNLATNVDFGSEVTIRLQARGCTGCHDAVQQAGGLDLTGTPQAIFDRVMLVGENRVVPGDLQQSYLLTKPLATRADVNHGGGKLVPNENDDFYLYVGGWIAENAGRYPPTPPLPIDFATQIVPRFQQQGCTGCHGVGGQAPQLAGDPAQIHAALLAEQSVIAYDGIPSLSYVLTKPLAAYPNVNHGGGKLIQNNDYDYYKYLQRWINEGAKQVP